MRRIVIAALLACFAWTAIAQNNGARQVPVGFCYLATLTPATAVTAATCVSATFNATATTTSLALTSTTTVTGVLLPGMGVAGTGIPTGTTLLAQVSGTPGGAGTYTMSAPTTGTSTTATSTSVSASTGVIQATNTFVAGQVVTFGSSGTLPAAYTVGTPYYVLAANLSASQYELSATNAGSVIVPATTTMTAVATSTAANLTAGGIPAGTTYAVMCAYGNSVNYRDDGGAATTTIGTGGQNIAVNTCTAYNGTFSQLSLFQSGGAATMGISFYQ